MYINRECCFNVKWNLRIDSPSWKQYFSGNKQINFTSGSVFSMDVKVIKLNKSCLYNSFEQYSYGL